MAEPTTSNDRRAKAVRATAGVAGALAFLGIGWAMGARATEAELAGWQAASGPAEPAQPAAPYPGEEPTSPSWGEWGTVPLPSDGDGDEWSGLLPAYPGDGGGGFLPPQTGTGGS